MWINSRKIANIAIRVTELPGEYAKGVVEGLEEVGGNIDETRRVPFRALADYFYILACYYRANGDNYNAGRALGKAIYFLHRWLVDTYKIPRVEVVSDLPRVCAEEQNKDKPACLLYVATLKVIKSFLSEMEIDRRSARRKYIAMRFLKGIVVASLIIIGGVVIAFGIPLLAGLVFASALLILRLWIPRAYIIAMKSGIILIKPRGLKNYIE